MQVRTKIIQPAQWKYVLSKQVFVFRWSAQSTYLYKYVLLYYTVRRTSDKDTFLVGHFARFGLSLPTLRTLCARHNYIKPIAKGGNR